ncbi:hypothetical protein PC116_g7687 [Phytophthora cactorum]|nr:hypothetical protein PC114_g27222 [Phytophthora cactorum]KAG3040905.1 hypothetical protein PC119_g1141 [Phytophthora cactorum]KAG4244520.1 hypothetical protein PC116_g7687 [Phytophthora cactorum]
MTGLPAMKPSDTIFVPGPIETATLDTIQTTQQQNVKRVQQALVGMHRRISQVNNAVRATGRQTHIKKKGTTMAQFDIGDFVLYADVWQHTRGKLRVKWCGPAQVVSTVSNWIFEIQNMVTGHRKEAHSSRLKFYADNSLDVNEDLLQHIAQNSEGHVVDFLLKARYNKTAKRHEIKVHWRGLDQLEDSWEPAEVLLEDVPNAVKAFVSTHNTLAPVNALRKALNIT